MNQISANLKVAVCNQIACIKIFGRANFTSSLDLNKLVTELWGHNYNHFVFDLTDCLAMDSTFLGVMSGLGLKFYGNGNGNGDAHLIELVNPNPRLAEDLDNLGVAHLFKISEHSEHLCDKFEPLTCMEGVKPADITRTCLKAHQTLIDINPANERKFKDVTQYLAENLKRQELAGKN